MNTARNQVRDRPDLRGHFSYDVEADGPCAGIYSMLSIGIVHLNNPSERFYAEFKPITSQYVEEAMLACNFTREKAMLLPEAEKSMKELKAWIDPFQERHGRLVSWSDNPAFDWQFLNHYCHRFIGYNPFGFSSRRIGDFSAGLSGSYRDTNSWKKLRTCKHTHNALDDALGNAGAILKLINQR